MEEREREGGTYGLGEMVEVDGGKAKEIVAAKPAYGRHLGSHKRKPSLAHLKTNTVELGGNAMKARAESNKGSRATVRGVKGANLQLAN